MATGIIFSLTMAGCCTETKINTILETKTSSPGSISTNAMKAISAPIYPLPDSPEEPLLKVHISAPSYLFSLKENDAPPFKKPGKEASPKLLIGSIMTEKEAVEMIAAGDVNQANGLKKWLSIFLIEKKIIQNFNISEKTFLISLLREVIEYAAQRDFSAFKLAVLITIYLSSHLYFKWYYWLTPSALWSYFKDIMIRHTIEDSPDGQEVFEPDECYDIVSHFHTVYMNNLPLIHILTFGAHRLKLQWPFKTK